MELFRKPQDASSPPSEGPETSAALVVLPRQAEEVAPLPDLRARYEAAVAELWGRLESPESQRAYREDWRRYVTWAEGQGIDPRAAGVDVVQLYVNHLRDEKKSKATRGRALSVIREVYRALVIAGICSINPAREVKNPKIDNTPRTPWLSEDKFRVFFDHVSSGDSWRERRDRLVILTLILTGWRRTEVARLRAEDINGNAARVVVKRGKDVVVGVPPYLLGEIEKWRAYAGIEAGPIFPRAPTDETAVSGKIIYDVVKGVARKAGMQKVAPHALRRTFITILEQRGVDIRDLQLAVSHDSVTTTERYQKASRAARQAPGEGLIDLVKSPAK